MYIKSMVIDGFKSYAQRTEVNGFDPMFNAITGLNGSGKSNILDAICFLLGISNLSQVRATNLQELVYKNGQAGVTKATVSVTFDNTDKKQSPLGYEQYDEITVTRQVVIGGRNRYLINGNNANNTRVQDLFRSVQLNVNNPHFLIMQGRITKVLNMKPPEILSMIEEAAGTRLYESKKEMAQKTIEKKDARLHEIDTILKDDITPTLSRLKEERSSYLEYQKVLRELEHLNKLVIAYQYTCCLETSAQSAAHLEETQQQIQALNTRRAEIADLLKELAAQLVDLEKRRDSEAGGVMERLEAALAARQKEDVKSQATLNAKKDAIKAENKKAGQLGKQLSRDQGAVASKQKELDKLSAAAQSVVEAAVADEAALTEAKDHFHAVSAGLSSNKDGDDATLNDQLMTAKKEVSTCEGERKKAEMALKHAQAEAKRKQAELKKTEASYKKDQATHQSVHDAKAKLEAELGKLNYEEGNEEGLQDRQRKLRDQVRKLSDQVEALEGRFPNLRFDYRDPERGFDRARVHGLVAKLIKVPDVANARALEVTAGGKLYQVVVDSEQTGKLLLQKGDLKRRVTIIPLNKITGQAMDQARVQRAEQLVGRENVHTALSLIQYDRKHQAAMEYVFGSAFVCADMAAAQRVTYDARVMKRTVTLDGDSCDPGGTLSGGARERGESVLAKLGELSAAHDALVAAQQDLAAVETELRTLAATAERWRTLSQQLELKSHEAQLLDERLQQGSHHQQLTELQALDDEIKEQQNVVTLATERGAAAAERAKELEYKVKNAAALREKELKDAEKAVKDAKAKLDKSKKASKEKEQECESARLELEALGKEITSVQGEITELQASIAAEEAKLEEMSGALAETKAAVAEAQAALTAQRDLLKECNKDIAKQAGEQKALQKEDSAAALKIAESEHKVTKCQKDAREAARQVEGLVQKFSWIAEEKQFFGQVGTAYDFDAQNPKEAGKRMERLSERKDKLSKSVNMRAMSMLEKADEQYTDLMKKRTVVLNDKAKIAAVIAELDEKKNEALKTAYKQVDKDFCSIFSTLLPGTQARLVPPEGASMLDGLEVKVAFGDVWKDSLGELSGGQRSLVALSLILSLLLFKPAPLYILDEVDAALDLSHTQNIGQMLRTHFTTSQFIVVSLKDGMFNNANVLFKTKFVDGVSTVTRYAQQQALRPLPAAKKPPAAKKAANKRARRDDEEAYSP